MRIGLIENPPWVIRTNDEPAGAEVELMRRFSAQMGAEPEWHWGGDEHLFGALELYELDVVAGGLSDETPWATQVGVTRYYFRENFDVGVPKGTQVGDIEGMTVAVNDPHMAGLLKQQGASTVAVNSIGDYPDRPVAAADWQIAHMGLTAAGFDLHSRRHVIAVAPGENQFVKRLEEFLSSQHDEVRAILAAQQEVQR